MTTRQHCPELVLQYKGPAHILIIISPPPAAPTKTYKFNNTITNLDALASPSLTAHEISADLYIQI